MGLMDLSTSVASKKHVDFSDARYQGVEKLKQNSKKNVRSTFTLYDNKEFNKIAVQEISAAYALSDKHLPIGELINKMVDLILDMEDGVLDTEKDAIYAWKYSNALLNMYDDKSKRKDTLFSFDNGLKNSVINSPIFIDRYPGKYTVRTNFFDPKLKVEFVNDIVQTFKDVSLPKIHNTAIKQSKEIAEAHNNAILDRIVQWAVQNYGCDVDSFFEIKEDEQTHLFYSTNTIILHLRNGYDMSIIGSVGTDHDDKFAISIFNAHEIAIMKHGERVNQGELKEAFTEATENDPVDPLTKLLSMERRKNAILKEQFQILAEIRPMIPAETLEITAAESVVGQDYIWGCKQFRTTHEDLPRDFKLEDVELPVFEETEQEKASQALISDVHSMTDTIAAETTKSKDVELKAKSMLDKINSGNIEEFQKEADAFMESENKPEEPTSLLPEIKAGEQKDPIETTAIERNPMIDREPEIVAPIEDMFAETTPQKNVQEKKFGDVEKVTYEMPVLNITPTAEQPVEKKEEKAFDTTATLLPGFTPPKEKPVEEDIFSTTAAAQPMPVFETQSEQKRIIEEPVAKAKQDPVVNDKPKQPDLLLDDLDSLFA